MTYTSGWSVIYGEQPTAAKWSELGANTDALANGSAIEAGAIVGAHIQESEFLVDPIGGVNSGFSATAWANFGTAGAVSWTSTVTEKIEFYIPFTYLTNTNGTGFDVQVLLDGSLPTVEASQINSFTGPSLLYTSGNSAGFSYALFGNTVVSAGAHTLQVQGRTQGSGTFILYHMIRVTRMNNS